MPYCKFPSSLILALTLSHATCSIVTASELPDARLSKLEVDLKAALSKKDYMRAAEIDSRMMPWFERKYGKHSAEMAKELFQYAELLHRAGLHDDAKEVEQQAAKATIKSGKPVEIGSRLLGLYSLMCPSGFSDRPIPTNDPTHTKELAHQFKRDAASITILLARVSADKSYSSADKYVRKAIPKATYNHGPSVSIRGIKCERVIYTKKSPKSIVGRCFFSNQGNNVLIITFEAPEKEWSVTGPILARSVATLKRII